MTQQRTADYPMLSEILQLPAFTGCSVCGGTAGLDHRVIGPNVTMATPNHPFLAEERAFADYPDGCHELEYAQPITIGDHCWLCSGVSACSMRAYSSKPVSLCQIVMGSKSKGGQVQRVP